MLTICTLPEETIRLRDDSAEALIEQMSHGNLSAMGELYTLIEKDVYAFALSKTASKRDAEDITHDTFVQIWKNATQYRCIGKPLAWIFTIEMNLIRKQFGKNQRFVPLEESCEENASEGDFTDNVINHEFLSCILAKLNEDEREIISLHIISGLKHREIAKLLGRPLSTVLSRYNRAIKKLQAEVADKERGL